MTLIKGSRGKSGRGYTIKTIKGKDYLYIWGSYNPDLTKKGRKSSDGYNNNYTYYDKWISCGRYGKPETWEKYLKLIGEKYGVEFNEHQARNMISEIETFYEETKNKETE